MLIVHDDDPAELLHAGARVGGPQKQRVGRFRIAAALTFRIVQVHNLLPGARELALGCVRVQLEQNRVAGNDIQQRTARFASATRARATRQVDRQDVDALQLTGAALIENVELTDGNDLIAPQLDAYGFRCPEAEQIEDAAAHGVFTDGFDER
jgi:hypothetical protein